MPFKDEDVEQSIHCLFSAALNPNSPSCHAVIVCLTTLIALQPVIASITSYAIPINRLLTEQRKIWLSECESTFANRYYVH